MESGIDVVVVNYRTPWDLSNFINSYTEFRDSNTHLWIVNVDPDPASHDVARTFLKYLKNCTYVHAPENVGYARAVNQAASLGERETLAIFNADTLLTADALSLCHEALHDHEEWGVLGPRQVDDRGKITHAGIFGTLEAPMHRGWMEHTDQYVDADDTAVTVSGAAYFIKRGVWNELTRCPLYAPYQADGAFLPTPHYYEETFCSYHAQAHGWKVVYYGPVTIVHKWHKASPVGGPADQQMSRSQAIFREACDAHGIPRD